MFEREYPTLVGVTWSEREEAAYAFVKKDDNVLYEDVFADEDDAALARELAIIWNGWDAERNYPAATLGNVCAEIARRLGPDSLSSESSSQWRWLEKIGMPRSEFEAAAK